MSLRLFNGFRVVVEQADDPAALLNFIVSLILMRDLGSSPGSSARTSTPCARATASTSCFCGHSFEEHRLNESSKGSPKL
eukprot:s9877_g1.t1